jgi:MFS family permease
LNLAPPDDFKLYSIACILFSLALVPVALSRRSKPHIVKPQRFNMRRLIRVSPVGVIGCVASGLITGAFYGLGPVYATQSGLSTAEISIFMGLCIIGALVVQVPIGRLSDLLGRRLMNVAILLGTALVSGLFLTTVTDDRMMLFALVTLYGGLSFSIYTLANAHANDLVSQEERVPVAANLLLAYSVGAVAGPLISALMMDGIGHDGLFWFSALVSLIMAGIVVMSMRFEQSTPQQTGSSLGIE